MEVIVPGKTWLHISFILSEKAEAKTFYDRKAMDRQKKGSLMALDVQNSGQISINSLLSLATELAT